MTRPYPVSVAIREMLHTDGKIECVTDPSRPDYWHSDQCNAIHDGILRIMQQWPPPLPGGPPIRHQKDLLTRS